MKNTKLIVLMLIPFLASCSKTSELYKDFAYNSSNFMENYYVETNGVRDLAVNSSTVHDLVNGETYFSNDNEHALDNIRDEDKVGNHPWSVFGTDKSNEYGRNYNLSNIDSSFAYGYLSKLYDGRVRCEGKYQLSRVQLDKDGFATYFPKKLVNYGYFGLSLRGATDYPNEGSTPSPLKTNKEPIYIDLHVSFYKHIDNSEKYDVVTFNLPNVNIPCDNGGDTNLVMFYLTGEEKIGDYRYKKYNLDNAVAMSLTYELKTYRGREDLTDDSKVEKEHHFAVMLYEVMFPNSSWK